MRVCRYETPSDEFAECPKPVIFLAGPTVRGHQQHLLPSWRTAAIEEFRKREFTGTLIVPEFSDKAESDKGRYDLPIWEYAGLKIADCIMFWIPRTRELIGLTTNFELGYWLRWREKLVYGRPNDAYRVDYLDIIWTHDYEESPRGISEIYSDLGQTIDAAMEVAAGVRTKNDRLKELTNRARLGDDAAAKQLIQELAG